MPQIHSAIGNTCDYAGILNKIRALYGENEYLYCKNVWDTHTMKYLVQPVLGIYNNIHHQTDNIADIASGYGFWTMLFAQRGKTVTGIDNNRQRIAILDQLRNDFPDITPLESDICNLHAVEDERFDLTFCASTLHVVPQYPTAVNEIIRITKKGGFILLLITNPSAPEILELYKGNSALQKTATKEHFDQILQYDASLISCAEIRYANNSTPPPHYAILYKKND